jgi:integrase/recombinase XerC
MNNLRLATEEYGKFVTQNANLSDATKKSYQNTINQFCSYWGYYKSISSISEKSFSSFVNNLNQNQYTNKSINAKVSALNNFIEYLNHTYNLNLQTISLFLNDKDSEEQIRILTLDEIKYLKKAIGNDLRSLAIVDLLLYSGIKVGEITSLKINQFHLINEGQGLLLLDNRKLTLKDEALQSILKFLATTKRGDADFLFHTNSGKNLDIRNIRRQVDRYIKKAGLKDISLFDLRHTFCVNFLKQKLPIQDLAYIADHKNLITTQKYLTFLDKDKP